MDIVLCCRKNNKNTSSQMGPHQKKNILKNFYEQNFSMVDFGILR